MFIESVSENLPVSKGGLETYHKAQSSNEVCSRVKEFCTSGWPKKHLVYRSRVVTLLEGQE